LKTGHVRPKPSRVDKKTQQSGEGCLEKYAVNDHDSQLVGKRDQKRKRRVRRYVLEAKKTNEKKAKKGWGSRQEN